jgi:hypothetical protein
MEGIGSPDMTLTPSDDEVLKDINAVFGALRAEYLHAEIFDLFTKPTYFSELLTTRPCLLVGGRGTGKTTVLRGMSFEGQAHLNPGGYSDWDFVGTYWRFDTSVVRAFKGASLDEETWSSVFAHYTNLVLCSLVLDFAYWFNGTSGNPLAFDQTLLRQAARLLGLPNGDSLEAVSEGVTEALITLEMFVNNAAGEPNPRLSLLGRPVTRLVDALRVPGGLDQRPVYFLLDEFENLMDYQQRVLNTLIKHSDARISYKVGMKDTGHRERTTLNPDEQLIDPADYALVDISNRLAKRSDFGDFAMEVCAGRLARIAGGLPRINELLVGLTEDQEARSLGSDQLIARTRVVLAREGATASELEAFDEMSSQSAVLVGFWAEGHRDESELAVLRDALRDPRRWDDKVNNYGHAALFTIRPRVRGLRKYYAGWDTYVQLAAGNVRYLLSLVREALVKQIESGAHLDEPIDAELQTLAAQEVGSRNLRQLQGLAVEGADLTRLVLSLGRVFGVMASQPHGHTPEVNQFRVLDTSAVEPAQKLLDAGVMHLALLRYAGDKMAAVSGEIRDFDYQLHPIFAPFFVYSYRRKRRFNIEAEELLALSQSPSETIKRILLRNKRSQDPDTRELPEQLTLFSEFFGE